MDSAELISIINASNYSTNSVLGNLSDIPDEEYTTDAKSYEMSYDTESSSVTDSKNEEVSSKFSWSSEGSDEIDFENAQDEISITRIVMDDDIRPKMEFDELSEPCNEPGSGSIETKSQIGTIGVEFPVIRINDVVLPSKMISKMIIYHNAIIPKIYLEFYASDTTFVNKNMPKDGDMVSIFMRTGTDGNVIPIRNDYVITSCSTNVIPKNGETRIALNGTLFVPNIIRRNLSVGYIGTSKEVMRNIAKDSSLGFAFNDFDNTDDMQNWISCKEPFEKFIGDITVHAWKDECSFFDSWIDLYYNLVYINVNKFMLTSENREEIDITFATSTKDWNMTNSDGKKEGQSPAMIKLLSNMPNFKGTPFYIKEWYPTNVSFSKSINYGYEIISNEYIHNHKLYTKSKNDCFESLSNIPAYDMDKINDYMILRGRNKYSKADNPENEMQRINYDFVNTYTSYEWNGIEYMKGTDEHDTDSNDTWSGNVHSNYKRAFGHNVINMEEMGKMYITVKCEGLCLQVMRGERIPVIITHDSYADSLLNNKEEDNDNERIGSRLYSGYYWVSGIVYDYEASRSSYSGFTTTFTLKRREWPTPESI